MEYQIHAAKVHHAFELGKNLFDLERIMLARSFPEVPCNTAPYLSLCNSEISWAAEWQGETCAMWGVLNDGLVWLMHDNRLNKYRRYLLKEMPHYVNIMNEVHPVIYSNIWAENKRLVKMVSWLGFEKVSEMTNFRGYGETFYRMEKRLCV